MNTIRDRGIAGLEEYDRMRSEREATAWRFLANFHPHAFSIERDAHRINHETVEAYMDGPYFQAEPSPEERDRIIGLGTIWEARVYPETSYAASSLEALIDKLMEEQA